MIDEGFGHWFAGLADGEGSFVIHCTKRVNGASYHPAFVLSLRDDDRSTVETIATTLGVGRVYHRPRAGTSNPTTQFHVHKSDDCAALVELFDHYPLRSRKARDYAIWREAVRVYRALPRRNSHRPRDWSAMLALKESLEDVRAYRGPR